MQRIFKLFQRKKVLAVSGLNSEIIKEAGSKYNFVQSELKLIRANESYVFEAGENAIFRITPDNHKTFEEICAQTAWQHYLNKNYEQAAEVLYSPFGNLAETIQTETGSYTVVVQKKYIGKIITSKEWINKLFFKIGKLTGKFHALTKLYNPDTIISQLKCWSISNPEKIKKLIPETEHFLTRKFESCLLEIERLTITKENFGMVHYDIHRGNMLLNNNNICIFDFEDACHTWFVSDIASVLFHALMNNKKTLNESRSYLKNFTHYFFQGYKTENSIAENELLWLPHFLSLRTIANYAYLHKIWDFRNLDPSQKEFAELNKILAYADYINLDIDY
ncbi:MAG: phosphotransferase [Bacteroidia bacterium]